jgi:hypothetical protein
MGLAKVGALWRKKKAGGEEFFAGEVNSPGSVLIFKNKRKSGPRDPDYIITQDDGHGSGRVQDSAAVQLARRNAAGLGTIEDQQNDQFIQRLDELDEPNAALSSQANPPPTPSPAERLAAAKWATYKPADF